MSMDQFIELITVLMPLILAVVGFIFKLNTKQRDEVAHAVDYAIRMYKEGKFDRTAAESHILATGHVKESKVQTIMKEIEVRTSDTGKIEIYKNNVIPGVGLSIDAGGNARIFPQGAINRVSYKIRKYLKKKFN